MEGVSNIRVSSDAVFLAMRSFRHPQQQAWYLGEDLPWKDDWQRYPDPLAVQRRPKRAIERLGHRQKRNMRFGGS